jgi:HCOMODA/2-hydroxy-3-carboxy-muconic semialdehyde decarboxylase
MSTSGGPVDRATLEDLAAASRILADQGVFDAAGHVSMRHPGHSERFLMSRSLAPQMITADDIMEFDLDCNAIDARGRNGFIERYLHGEILRARPDVVAVAHSHSPSVIAFGLSNTPMLAMYHNAAFLAAGVPVFDIREKFGTTDIVISTAAKGAALAQVLADKPVALLRAHGMVAVGQVCRSRCSARSSPSPAPISSIRRWRSAVRSPRWMPRRGGSPTWSTCRPSAARGICGSSG